MSNVKTRLQAVHTHSFQEFAFQSVLDAGKMFQALLLLFGNALMFCGAWQIVYIIPSYSPFLQYTFPEDLLQQEHSDNVSYASLNQLYQQLDDGDFTFTSNTTLVFGEGDHIIGPEVPGHFIISDVYDVSLVGAGGATITCVNPYGFAFLNAVNVVLQNLTIVNCGAKLSIQVVYETLAIQTQLLAIQSQFTWKIGNQPKVALFAVNIHSLTMIAVEVRNSSGHGLLGLNLFGNSEIVRSQFVDNNIHSYSHCWSRYLSQSQAVDCQGGNVLLLYSDLYFKPEQPLVIDLTVRESEFIGGVDFVEGMYKQGHVLVGSGLGVAMTQRTYGVRVLLEGSVFSGNTAVSKGANLYFQMSNSVVNSSVIIKNCDSTFGNRFFKPPSDTSYPVGCYPALTFIHGIFNGAEVSRFSDRKIREEVLRVEDSTFADNFCGAVYIQFASGYQSSESLVTHTAVINNSYFLENLFGDGDTHFVLWAMDSIRTSQQAELVIENSQILYNGLTDDFTEVLNDLLSNGLLFEFPQESYRLFGNLKFSSMKNVTIRNCAFVENFMSPVHATDSNIFFEGYNLFMNNSAFFGSGLYLTKDSVAYLDPHTQLVFENNEAYFKGGAVYITQDKLDSDHLCSLQIFDPALTPFSELETRIWFINNFALIAGDTVYGGNVDYCLAASPSAFFLSNVTTIGYGKFIFDFVSDFEGQPESNSLISSDADRLCFCNEGVKDCEKLNETAFLYPGEVFRISVVGIGQRRGNTPANVIAAKRTGTGVELQKVGRECSNVTYDIQEDITWLLLFPDSTIIRQNGVTLPIDIVILACPVGFEINNSTKVCECETSLKLRGMTNCDIVTQTIIRLPPYWLSNYSHHLLLHDHCPFDYCKSTPVQITLKEPDTSKQCAFNRTGTLCGQCKEGLSLVFGTSRCLPCSNKYLALFIAFALAGIALVVFLFLLDLTVSIGTINGLIFYANIVKINEAIFFPPGDNSFLKVFISWVNLDLGIETCFYNGMDSYVKTWFQFIFPLYMWLILIVIIAGARKSITLARLCGNHAVPVLATLFLFSFTKLLRVIITALSFTTLAYPNGQKVLWLYDGNVEFGKQKQFPLLLFATLFLVALIPYTLLLTAVQLLRKCSHKIFKWVSKYMPIFDAYVGPYKHKYGYWTGLLLIVRVVLVLVFVFNIFGDPAVDILFIILVVFLLVVLNLGQGGVYKNNYLTALEISFMLNLGVLAAVTGYVRQTNGNQKAAVYTSTSIALGTFAVILVYHINDRIRKRYRKWQERKPSRNSIPLPRQDQLTNDGNKNRIIDEGVEKPKESIVIMLPENELHSLKDFESKDSTM